MLDAKLAQRIKPKHQHELTQEILHTYASGKVAKDNVLRVYRILNQENIVTWEDDFADYFEEYRRHQNSDALFTDLEQLFQKYRVDLREKRTPKALTLQDFEVIAYIFLSKEDFKHLTLEA